MKLFPTFQFIESPLSSYAVETPLGNVTSYVLVNNQDVAIRASTMQKLATTGHMAHWQLPYCTIESVLTRPALIQEYWDEITDCWAYLWRIYVHEPLDRLEFVSTLSAPHRLTGGYDAGQYLAAQTWDDQTWMLTLGTEGEDALYNRAQMNDWLPQRYVAQATEWGELPFVEYLSNGLRITLEDVQAEDRVQAQFVTAWARYDAESASTWYAVNVDARHILQGAVGKRLWP